MKYPHETCQGYGFKMAAYSHDKVCRNFPLIPPVLRPKQEKVIEELMRGNDVLAVLPTGYGKLLTYLMPALARGGITLVISPLISDSYIF